MCVYVSERTCALIKGCVLAFAACLSGFKTLHRINPIVTLSCVKEYILIKYLPVTREIAADHFLAGLPCLFPC